MDRADEIDDAERRWVAQMGSTTHKVDREDEVDDRAKLDRADEVDDAEENRADGGDREPTRPVDGMPNRRRWL